MELIIIITLIIAAVVVIAEIAGQIVYGTWTYIDIDLDKYVLNDLDRSMLFSLYRPYVSKAYMASSKYYIDGIGPVPRWSKTHKKIQDRYNELLLSK
jgi:hypothetical protein